MVKIIEITPDKQKASSLRKMAESTLNRITDTDEEAYPTQVIKDYYDVIHYLLEAISLSIGKKVKGKGAHAQLITLISSEHNLEASIEQFLQDLRRHRNRIAYEGFFMPPDYLKRNEQRIKQVIERLKTILQQVEK